MGTGVPLAELTAAAVEAGHRFLEGHDDETRDEDRLRTEAGHPVRVTVMSDSAHVWLRTINTTSRELKHGSDISIVVSKVY